MKYSDLRPKLDPFGCSEATIEEYFNAIPYVKLRKLALLRRKENPISGNTHANSLTQAIEAGFLWNDTPEGDDFWSSIDDCLSETIGTPDLKEWEDSL